MAKSNSSDKLSYGLTILIFGVIYLLDKVGILSVIPYANRLFTVGGIFLVAGIVFVITQPRRVLSWVFLGIGVILNFNFLFGWLQSYSKFLIPLALVLVGLSMVLSSRKR